MLGGRLLTQANKRSLVIFDRHDRHVPCSQRPPTTPLQRVEGISVLISRSSPSLKAPPPKRDGSAPSSAPGDRNLFRSHSPVETPAPDV